ncbi:MAG: hypothetical protein JWP03_437 [Phycisphaerales bacterium]|nr:hypothetical protein [Phycisphaerales bacterium]
MPATNEANEIIVRIRMKDNSAAINPTEPSAIDTSKKVPVTVITGRLGAGDGRMPRKIKWAAIMSVMPDVDRTKASFASACRFPCCAGA